jgi:hypothetical protein
MEDTRIMPMSLFNLHDRDSGRIALLGIGFLVAGLLALVLGIRSDPLLLGEERYFPVPGEYDVDIPRPGCYAVFHQNGQCNSFEAPLVKASGEIEYPDGVSFTFCRKGGSDAILPRGSVSGWAPASEGKTGVDALDFHFEKAGCHILSLRRAEGPPRFPTLLFMQSRFSPTACNVFTRIGIVLVCASIALFTRRYWTKR